VRFSPTATVGDENDALARSAPQAEQLPLVLQFSVPQTGQSISDSEEGYGVDRAYALLPSSSNPVR